MKLTPLGKALIFLVGLGLVVTAIDRYLPEGQRPWRRWTGGGSKPSAEATPSGAPTTASSGAPSTSRSAGNSWVTVPAGRFIAGADADDRSVAAFRVHKTEVTNREFQAFVAACAIGSDCGPRELPSYWDDVAYLDTHLDFPVVFAGWGEASAYCRWTGGRLPTILEWEKAARGTDGRLFPWGSSLEFDAVNILGPEKHGDKSKAPKQIPTWAVNDPRYRKDAGPYGVLGMAGNVSEWTSSASENEPNLMLVAGGSWDSWEFNDARVYHRVPKTPTDRSSSVGFRCVSDAP